MAAAGCTDVDAIDEAILRKMIRSLKGLFTGYDSDENKKKPLATRLADAKREVENAEKILARTDCYPELRLFLRELAEACDDALERIESVIRRSPNIRT